jgi:hypothetical protein
MTIMNMSAMMMMMMMTTTTTMMMMIIIITTRPQIPGFWASKTERIEIKQKVSEEFYTALSNMLKKGID